MSKPASGPNTALRPTELLDVDGWVFDVDGTLVLGDTRLKGYRPLPGAVELLDRLQREGRPFVAFTNGTTKTPAEYARTLRALDLPIDEQRMVTPVSVAIDLFRRRGHHRLLVLGVEGVWRPLAEAGFDVVVSPGAADGVQAVLIGWHPEFALADLEVASQALWAGARFYTVSSAPFFAAAGGRALGVSGAISAALRNVTGRRAFVVGKPAQQALRAAAARMGLLPDRVAVVGDDPVLEIAMARRGGAKAVAVHTGNNDAAAFAAASPDLRPHLSLRGVHELLARLEGAAG